MPFGRSLCRVHAGPARHPSVRGRERAHGSHRHELDPPTIGLLGGALRLRGATARRPPQRVLRGPAPLHRRLTRRCAFPLALGRVLRRDRRGCVPLDQRPVSPHHRRRSPGVGARLASCGCADSLHDARRPVSLGGRSGRNDTGNVERRAGGRRAQPGGRRPRRPLGGRRSPPHRLSSCNSSCQPRVPNLACGTPRAVDRSAKEQHEPDHRGRRPRQALPHQGG